MTKKMKKSETGGSSLKNQHKKRFQRRDHMVAVNHGGSGELQSELSVKPHPEPAAVHGEQSWDKRAFVLRFSTFT